MSGAPVRVFLAGEGTNELGSRSGDPAYASDASPGVVEALLRRVRPDGWAVGGARQWKSVRKFRAGARARLAAAGVEPTDATTLNARLGRAGGVLSPGAAAASD